MCLFVSSLTRLFIRKITKTYAVFYSTSSTTGIAAMRPGPRVHGMGRLFFKVGELCLFLLIISTEIVYFIVHRINRASLNTPVVTFQVISG
jgi:hypothetical protein